MVEAFTFSDLVYSFRKGIISESYFKNKLYEYLENVYHEGVGKLPSQAMLSSIVERVTMSIEDPDAFYSATNRYKVINEIKGLTTDAYEVFHAFEDRVVLDTVKSADNRKEIGISIGLQTGTIFVRISGKKPSRIGDEPMVSTYALADEMIVKTVDQITGRPDNSYSGIDKSVICTRFDPSHMQVVHSGGTTGKEQIHKNRYDDAGIAAGVERSLYESYFRAEARCPHFHFFRKSVCEKLHNNSASFAINMNDLSRYILDLDSALKQESEEVPAILQYDLGMPFIYILRYKKEWNGADFAKQAGQIFKRYYGGKKCEAMKMLQDLMDSINLGDTARGLAIAADIICYVNETPIPVEVAKIVSDDTNEQLGDGSGRLGAGRMQKFVTMDERPNRDYLVERPHSGELAEITDTNIRFATKLASTFIDSLGEQVQAETLLRDRRERRDGRFSEDDDDEPKA